MAGRAWFRRLRAEIPTRPRSLEPSGLPQPYSIETHAKADAQRAIRVIRSRAKEWAIDPAKIGIVGFSAGGEVAGLAASEPLDARPDATDPTDRVSSKPDFVALIYPGGLQRPELSANATRLPPTFLLCTYDDRMPADLAALFIKLKAANVNTEMHIYNEGGHGFGVRKRSFAVSHWPDRFVEWLSDRGFAK